MATRFIEGVDPNSDHTISTILTALKNMVGPHQVPLVFDQDTGLVHYYDKVNDAARTVVNLNQAQTLTGKTLTSPTVTGGTFSAPTINDAVGLHANETLAALDTLTAADSGKIIFLSHATEFAVTLPAPAAGLEFTFIVANAPESADYTIVTEGGCQVMGGHVLTSDVYTDSAVDADVEAGLTGTTITFVQAVSVIGDKAYVVSDGNGWYVSCACAAVGGITITG